MRPRSLARRLAFQYLFVHEQNRGDCEPPEDFLAEQTRDAAVRAHAAALVATALARRAEVDELLTAVADNYRLDRIARVERAVLALGAAELLEGQTPPRVVIDECVEMAKRFGGKDSGRFVNGLLDAAAKAMKRCDT